MNFTPFGTTFSTTIPTGNAVAQFTTAKFSQAGGQVVGLLSSDEATGVTYLRPIDPSSNGFTLNLQGNGSDGAQCDGSLQIFTLPISVPGAKPGDLPQQQTLQIQVLNSNPGNSGSGGTGSGEKLHTMPITLQPAAFQQGAVLTVAYNSQDHGEPIQLQLQAADDVGQNNNNNNTNNNNSIPSGNESPSTQQTINSDEMQIDQDGQDTGEGNQNFPVVVTHIPSDLILRADDGMNEDKDIKDIKPDKKEGDAYTNTSGTSTGAAMPTFALQSLAPPGSVVADYLSRLPTTATGLPLSLHHFLKLSAETIKREANIEENSLGTQTTDESQDHNGATIAHLVTQEDMGDGGDPNQIDDGTGKGSKKKKKYKKKPPKPKRPRPGQVHIAVALDGTTLFCCPECNMAYPEKEMLEQHLVAHKIERRFICDICGAGLKRKEHLERHKLGHNPDRPYICSVCCKGFKRKEHLNLHFVIHSGEKSEVCSECGKGFHRKDHLRKHAKSHMMKRVKEEAAAAAAAMNNNGVVGNVVPHHTDEETGLVVVAATADNSTDADQSLQDHVGTIIMHTASNENSTEDPSNDHVGTIIMHATTPLQQHTQQ